METTPICSTTSSLLIFFKISLDYIVGRADKRQIDQDGLDEVDLLILNALKKMDKAEKEKCLKHIELEISLKSNSDK